LFRNFLFLCFILPIFCFAKNESAHADKSKILIRAIKISGNEITKPQFILREMRIAAGDSLAKSDIDAELMFNKKRILNLQLFSTVNYFVTTNVDQSIDIEYVVTEIFYWIPNPIFSLADRNFNVWWVEHKHNLDRTNIGLELTRLNFRGRNERLIATAQLGYSKYFDFSYKIPYIDKSLKHGIYIGLQYITGREINYKTEHNKIVFYRNDDYPFDRFQFKCSYSFRNAYVATHELQLLYHHFRISQSLYDLNPDFLGQKNKVNYFELAYQYAYNNTDVRIYPIEGIDMKSFISKKGFGIDKDVNQLILFNETSIYKRLYRDVSSSVVFRGRLMFPSHQPYFLDRAMGFKNEYIRGYEYYVIDGGHYALLRGNIRYKLLDQVIHQNALKMIRFIPLRLYFKLYDDIGYVNNQRPHDDHFNNKILNGYGAGMDIVISYYIKFRVEYSFNHLHQNGLFLHGSKE